MLGGGGGGTFQERPVAQQKEPKPTPHSQYRKWDKGIVLYGSQFSSSGCVYYIFTWAIVAVPCYVVVSYASQAEGMATGQSNRLVEYFLT